MDATLLTVETYLSPAGRRAALLHDARRGLASSPKRLSPVWFYDERGSLLFDEITRLPEYYLTRAERSILDARSREIVDAADADTLVELGSGTSEKTRILLDAMVEAGSLQRFIPFDVSEEVLRAAAADIMRTYRIPVTAVVGDFHQHLVRLPREGRRLVAFLGSTIGNLAPAERHRFLTDLATTMQPGDTLLLGADLVKDRARLLAAYNDAAGVTAAFNRNVLEVLNAELGSHFDAAAFDHLATWNEVERRIEMRLRSQRDQTVPVRALDLDVHFAPGEDLLTEISSKFTVDQVSAELEAAGFTLECSWTDDAGDFLLVLARWEPRREGRLLAAEVRSATD